ncbi:protoporphyrinogen oxidase [Paenibacillus sp. y28]|uniref:protoporphyrinogen oxidase n=1 Tax=Paenibacillus sp. y28 TaxID=3129110 RepID=UPI0030162DA6
MGTQAGVFRLAVIGGGVSGLSAAYYAQQQLREQGIAAEITLLEKSRRLGGKIHTLHKEGFVIEKGADSFLARKLPIIELSRELGLEGELTGTNPAAKKTYILQNGKLHRMPAGLVLGIPTEITPFLKTGLISPKGKLRAALDLVLPRRKEQGDESLGQFLTRRVGREVLERVAEPLLAGIYAGDTFALSLQSTFPQFQALERKHGSLIRGMMMNRRANGQETKGLPNIAQNSMFLTYKGGLSTVINRLVEACNGISIRTGVGVEGLERNGSAEIDTRDGMAREAVMRPADGQAALTAEEGRTANRSTSASGQEQRSRAARYRLRLTDGSTLDADAVVIALPTYAAGELLRDVPAYDPIAAMPYVSVANVVMAFRKEDVPQILDGTGFLVPRREGRSITASTWTSVKWLHTAPDGGLLLRCYVGRSGEEELVQAPDEQIIARVRHDVRELMGISAEPQFTEITRLLRSMPQYPVGHVENVRRLREYLNEHRPGLVVCGAGYNGVGIPDCVRQGREAAQAIAAFAKQAVQGTAARQTGDAPLAQTM